MTPRWARRKRVEELRMARYPGGFVKTTLPPLDLTEWQAGVDRMHRLPAPPEAVQIDELRRRFNLPEQEPS